MIIYDVLTVIISASLGAFFALQIKKRNEKREAKKERLDALRLVVSDVLPFVMTNYLSGLNIMDMTDEEARKHRHYCLGLVRKAKVQFFINQDDLDRSWEIVLSNDFGLLEGVLQRFTEQDIYLNHPNIQKQVYADLERANTNLRRILKYLETKIDI